MAFAWTIVMASITFNVIVKLFYFSLAFWGFGQSLTTIIYDHIKFKWYFNFFYFLLWVGDLFHMGIDYFLDTNLGSTFLGTSHNINEQWIKQKWPCFGCFNLYNFSNILFWISIKLTPLSFNATIVL